MTTISRRKAFTALAALPVTAGTTAALGLAGTSEAATLPTTVPASAADRAAYHWAEFARAMDELTPPDHFGWIVHGFRRRPHEALAGHSPHLRIDTIVYEALRPGFAEWHRPLDLPFAPRPEVRS